MMTDLQQRLRETLKELPAHVTLVAVSKFHPFEAIREAYEAGQLDFGESRAQELMPKHEALPADIHWHFIGTLQKNKVKYIAPFVSLIHSVDSPELLEEIDKQGRRVDRVIPCLLELRVAAEDTKSGWEPAECAKWLDSGARLSLQHVKIRGIMCMASHTDDEERIRADFRKAYDFYRMARASWFKDDSSFSIRSWGMSDDYHIAVEEGSNMVRIGTHIFGERQY